MQKDGDTPLDQTDQAAKIERLCNAGPPFKMYNYADTEDPKSITYWTINNKRSDDRVEGEDTAISYGPAKYPTSARFRRGPSYYPRSNGTDFPNNSTTPSTNSPHSSRLVISNNAQHTASGLCESESSFGPDFFNPADGTFCRMTDKTLWPVCDNSTAVDNCFHKDLQKLVVNGLATRDTPYDNVLDWTSDN